MANHTKKKKFKLLNGGWSGDFDVNDIVEIETIPCVKVTYKYHTALHTRQTFMFVKDIGLDDLKELRKS